MADLSTSYMGLKLKSPIIVGSSGLTNSVSDIKEHEQNGAGAVVLKSIFEEEISMEYEDMIKNVHPTHMEHFDYFDYKIKEDNIKKYLKLITDLKKNVSLPIIASVNCVYSHEWAFFSKKLEEAGADALELNMFFLPTDFSRNTAQTEKAYFDLIEKVRAEIKIPIALKISPYFSNLGPMIQRLSETGIKSLVLFNRFFCPDFDIDKMEVTSGHVLSTSEDVAQSLRWIAIMSGRVNCDLASSTGVHDGKAAIKQILAGAKAVQVVSALYRNGSSFLRDMNKEIETWMNNKNFQKIEDFRGKLSQSKSENPAKYERVQFMRYFAERA